MKTKFLTVILFVAVPFSAFAISSERCYHEGESFSSHDRSAKCCKADGLKPIRLIKEVDGKCSPVANQPFACSKCGDSKCSGNENFCNCRRDCKKTK